MARTAVVVRGAAGAMRCRNSLAVAVVDLVVAEHEREARRSADRSGGGDLAEFAALHVGHVAQEHDTRR